MDYQLETVLPCHGCGEHDRKRYKISTKAAVQGLKSGEAYCYSCLKRSPSACQACDILTENHVMHRVNSGPIKWLRICLICEDKDFRLGTDTINNLYHAQTDPTDLS